MIVLPCLKVMVPEGKSTAPVIAALNNTFSPTFVDSAGDAVSDTVISLGTIVKDFVRVPV